MNKQLVLKKLKKLYPNKTIVCLPKNNPTEILCELEPSGKHTEYSLVVSVIDKSVEHYHLMTTEHYKVIKGELDLFVDGVKHHLAEGDEFVLKPKQRHYAIGSETWVECYSTPGWTAGDHFLD